MAKFAQRHSWNVSFAIDHQKYLALPDDTVNRCKFAGRHYVYYYIQF
jgi:hypothetical protein